MKVSVFVWIGAAVVAAVLGGCTGEEAGLLPTAAAPLFGEPGGPVQAQGVPRAVFRTTPSDVEGAITGPSPLSVQFNLCQSRPESEDDDLKFTYDFDGDGTVDEFGHCRATHVYENGGKDRRCTPARVCVSDRRPGNEVCRSYEVCVEGAAPPSGPAPVPTIAEVEPNDDGAPGIGSWGAGVYGGDFAPDAADAGPAITGATDVLGSIGTPGDEDYFLVRNTGPDRISVVAWLYSPSGPASCPRGTLSARRRDGTIRVAGYGPCIGIGFDLLPGTSGYVAAMAINDGTDPALATYDYRLSFTFLPSQGYGPL